MGCYNSIVINSPANKVWNVLKNFHDLSWSKNVVSKVEIIGDKSASEIGAKRILNDAFHETLLTLDNESMSFTYSIDDGPDLVSKNNVTGYIGKVTVFSVSDNDTSFVLWTSNWDSEKKSGVADFCNPIYRAILQDLKNYLE